MAPEIGLTVGAALMAAHRITARLRRELSDLCKAGLFPADHTDAESESVETDEGTP